LCTQWVLNVKSIAGILPLLLPFVPGYAVAGLS
jgi:hypothetical protein